jgi:hypothetical protein
MKTGFRGTFVISWSQTDVDGLEAAPVQALSVGASWSWRGDAVRVDGPSDILKLDRAVGAEALRKRAARMVHRLVGAALDPARPFDFKSGLDEDAPLADGSFVITDGAQSYTVTLIDVGRGSQPLLMFVDEMPPRNCDMWVVHHTLGSGRPSPMTSDSGVICFTPGTRISTPGGPQAVETLEIGDLVLTKDNGPQPIEWIGSRRMTGARLFAMPALRPVRIRTGALGVKRPDQELLVSPEHRMLLQGAAAQELFNTSEVLVAAKHLINNRTIVVDAAVREVTYVHLLLSGHNVIWANGVQTESFHPAHADLGTLDPADRARLLSHYPSLDFDPHTYGGYARRTLTASEAAIFGHVA